MALFSSSVPFRSSWWADPIPEVDVDFWPLANFDVRSPFGLPRSILRAQRSLQHGGQKKAVSQEVVSDKDKFQVILHMPNFKQDEIKVKVIENSLDVDAEHEEKQDEHGHVYRHIHRRYHLPRSADLDKFSSTFSDNGTLTICAPKKPFETKNERTIEVKQIASGQDQPKLEQKQGNEQMEVDTNQDQKKSSAKDTSQEKKPSGIKVPVSHAATTGNKK